MKNLISGFSSRINLISNSRFLSNVSNATQDVLTDTFSRKHTYLRISLTEKCNLRCRYCMPEKGVNLTDREYLLTKEERMKLIDLFIGLGVNKIRFTGGEPTISNQLIGLIKYASNHQSNQLNSIGITSNGLLLSEQLIELQNAGLTSVNISLDTLNKDNFSQITRRDSKLFDRVWKSIMHSKGLGLSTKINNVVMRGINDNELANFVQLAIDYDLTVRFIELMPFDGNKWNPNLFVSYYEMIDRISKESNFNLVKLKGKEDPNDTTKWYKIQGKENGKIGFITSMSSHFCGSCNRIRLTADGKLRNCLFGTDGANLRDALRSNLSNQEIYDLISQTITSKKQALGGHADAISIASSTHNRPMILIGG